VENRATLARPRHRVIERTRDTFVRASRRSGKVSGLVLDTVRGFCHFGTNRTTLAQRRCGVYRGREHWMRVTHGIAGSLDEAAFDREGERLVGKVGSVASGRQAQKLSPRPRRQAADAHEDGVGKSRRNVHGVGDFAVLAPTRNALAHDLERIERMTGGELRDSLDVVTARIPSAACTTSSRIASSASAPTESLANCASKPKPKRQVKRAATRTSSRRRAKRMQAQEEGSAH
jgi:hypothetical protein